jgi:hypothetical protein
MTRATCRTWTKSFLSDVTTSDFVYGVLGAGALWGLCYIVRCCLRHSRRIDGVIQDIEERAHTCKDEAVDDLLIEAIGYGHTSMSMRQQMRIISTMHFLMGRRKSIQAKKDSPCSPRT